MAYESKEAVHELAEALFAEYDVDGNGWLSRTEFKKGINKTPRFKALVLGLCGAHWQPLFDALDADHDGKIEKEELVRFLLAKLLAKKGEGNQEEPVPNANTVATGDDSQPAQTGADKPHVGEVANCEEVAKDVGLTSSKHSFSPERPSAGLRKRFTTGGASTTLVDSGDDVAARASSDRSNQAAEAVDAEDVQLLDAFSDTSDEAQEQPSVDASNADDAVLGETGEGDGSIMALDEDAFRVRANADDGLVLYQRPGVSGVASLCATSVAIHAFCAIHKLPITVVNTVNTAISKTDSLPLLCIGHSRVLSSPKAIFSYLSERVFGEGQSGSCAEFFSLTQPLLFHVNKALFAQQTATTAGAGKEEEGSWLWPDSRNVLYSKCYSVYPFPLNRLLWWLHALDGSTKSAVTANSTQSVDIDVEDVLIAVAAKLAETYQQTEKLALSTAEEKTPIFTAADAVVYGAFEVVTNIFHAARLHSNDGLGHVNANATATVSGEQLHRSFLQYPILLDFYARWKEVVHAHNPAH